MKTTIDHKGKIWKNLFSCRTETKIGIRKKSKETELGSPKKTKLGMSHNPQRYSFAIFRIMTPIDSAERIMSSYYSDFQRSILLSYAQASLSQNIELLIFWAFSLNKKVLACT